MDWKGLIDFEEVPTVDGTELLSKLADEWSGLTEKSSPVSADLLLIEDSADSGAKKKVQVGNLGGGTGDVSGPGSATDEALVRFDATTGKLVQNSLATLDDTGHMGVNIAPMSSIGARARSFGASPYGVNVGATTQYDNLDIDDYGSAQFHSATQNFTLTGCSSQDHGKYLYVTNLSTYTLTIAHDSASSTSSSRFACPNGAAMVVPPGGGALFEWTTTSSRWQCVATTGLSVVGQAQGDILYFNGTSWVRLAAGTSGHFLKTLGTGANPVWAAASAGESFKEYLFQADMLESPNSSDWAVNALAPLTPGPSNAGLNVRRFDDTTAEGVGFTVKVPTGATNIIFDFLSRKATAPGTAQSVALNLYEREIPDNAAVTSWSSAFALTNVAMPANAYYQEDTQTITLATLGLTAGRMHQFELTRNAPAAGDTLTGDWCLHSVRVRFS